MNKEKEIEEMAHCIGTTNFLCAEDCDNCIQIRKKCNFIKYAKALYNAGYRNCANVGIDEFVEKYAVQARKATVKEIAERMKKHYEDSAEICKQIDELVEEVYDE